MITLRADLTLGNFVEFTFATGRPQGHQVLTNLISQIISVSCMFSLKIVRLLVRISVLLTHLAQRFLTSRKFIL